MRLLQIPSRGTRARAREQMPAAYTRRTTAVRVQAKGAGTAVTATGTTTAYTQLRGIKVFRASDGERIDLTTLWGPNERAVVAFARELAIQLRRDVKPKLDERGIKLFLVSIGTHERSKEFVQVTDFPAELLFADPNSDTYAALGLVKSVSQTFFSWNTPLSFKKRIEEGRMGDLQDILKRWIPWIPPKQDQAFQQGGMFVFEGDRTLFTHYDQATGAHADFAEVLGVAAQLGEADCGGACELPPPKRSA